MVGTPRARESVLGLCKVGYWFNRIGAWQNARRQMKKPWSIYTVINVHCTETTENTKPQTVVMTYCCDSVGVV